MKKKSQNSPRKKEAPMKKAKKELRIKVVKGTQENVQSPEQKKLLAEEQRKNQIDLIMEFSWERDIEHAGKPYCATAPIVQVNVPQLIGLPTANNSITVEADPLDFIKLSRTNSDPWKIHAHADIWKYTLDKYIYEYYRLKDRQSGLEQRQNWERITFPFDISEKIRKHKESIKNSNSKSIREAYLQPSSSKGVPIDDSTYETPSIGKAFFLNTYLNSLYLSSNAGDDKLFSLTYGGLPFKRKTEFDEVYEVPPFQLEDYYLHEKISCISLAIEVASIMVETKDFFRREFGDDDTIFETIFNEFSQKALPTIISSNYFFTRNTVARNFFQQIMLDLTINSYLWKNNSTTSDGFPSILPQLIQHATSHLHSIPSKNETTVYYSGRPKHQFTIKIDNALPDFDIDEIEQMLKHLENLLGAVIEPVSIPAYIKEPTHGLAMFCNPKHKYVEHFLSILSGGVQTYPSYQKASTEYKVFYNVRKAIASAQKFVSEYDSDSSKKIQYNVNIPQEFWDACNDRDASALFLERDLLQNLIAEQKSLSAKIIKSRILTDQVKKIHKKSNFFSEDNIQIWEYNGKQIIYLKFSN